MQLQQLIKRDKFEDLMKSYIEAKTAEGLRLDFTISDIDHKHPEIKYYYEQLGGERIRALGYKESHLKVELKNWRRETQVPYELQEQLRNGQRITNALLKQTIQNVYDQLEIKKTAKATDIIRYYPSSKGGQKFTDTTTGRRVNGWIIQLD